jgi:hypothetical protein
VAPKGFGPRLGKAAGFVDELSSSGRTCSGSIALVDRSRFDGAVINFNKGVC